MNQNSSSSTTPTTVRLPNSLKHRLRERAKAEHRSTHNLLVKIIATGLDKIEEEAARAN